MIKLNRKIPIRLIIISTLLTLTLSAGPVLAAKEPFVGSFFHQSLSGDPITNGVMAIHSDGTTAISLAGMFCIEGPAACGQLLSPERGTWKKTGENEITVVEIQFRTTDTVGGNFTNGGIIAKFTWVQTFDDMQRGSYQSWVADDVVAEFFTYDQNPITDDPILVIDPLPILPWAGQRINVE